MEGWSCCVVWLVMNNGWMTGLPRVPPSLPQGVAATLLRRLPTTLTEDWRLLTGQSLHISHDEHTQEVGGRAESGSRAYEEGGG